MSGLSYYLIIQKGTLLEGTAWEEASFCCALGPPCQVKSYKHPQQLAWQRQHLLVPGVLSVYPCRPWVL